MSKTFSLNPRKPLSEEDARKIEEAIAAKGEGVAGYDAMSSQAHRTAGSLDGALRIEPDHVAEATPERSAEKATKAASPSPKGASRHRSSGPRKHAREVPVTGVGTLHNPRVRKADGVQTRSTTVHLPVELAKKLAVHCAVNGRRQSEVISEAVQAMLEE